MGTPELQQFFFVEVKITSSDLFSNVMDVAVKYRLWLYKLPRCVSYELFGNLKPTPRLSRVKMRIRTVR